MSDEKDVKTPVEAQPKPKRHSNKRLRTVEPSWIKKAALTILYRKINQLLERGADGLIEKDDVEILLKAIEAARKLEKDSDGEAEFDPLKIT
jgi:hypothetical protein